MGYETRRTLARGIRHVSPGLNPKSMRDFLFSGLVLMEVWHHYGSRIGQWISMSGCWTCGVISQHPSAATLPSLPRQNELLQDSAGSRLRTVQITGPVLFTNHSIRRPSCTLCKPDPRQHPVFFLRACLSRQSVPIADFAEVFPGIGTLRECAHA